MLQKKMPSQQAEQNPLFAGGHNGVDFNNGFSIQESLRATVKYAESLQDAMTHGVNAMAHRANNVKKYLSQIKNSGSNDPNDEI